MPSARPLSDNYRGILYMLASCICFIVNDTFVKLASADLPIPQIIVIRSLIALPVVILFCWQQGLLVGLFRIPDRFLVWRTVGEVGGTATYLSALAHLEIANATAIGQLNPLAVTAGAAIFLGEKVGVRRWTAIAIGLFAVLLVIRPGTAGFNAWSLMALSSIFFVTGRDLASRLMPLSVHPMTVTVVSLVALIPLGLLMSIFEPWEAVTRPALLYCFGAAVTLSVAYVLIVQAMRFGEVAVVAPFRYSFLLWALLIQIFVFSVLPDGLTLLGSALLVATGIYTLYRERKVKGEKAGALTGVSATVPPPA
jgi:drug/metabolite transporter (DMT)-like permease